MERLCSHSGAWKEQDTVTCLTLMLSCPCVAGHVMYDRLNSVVSKRANKVEDTARFVLPDPYLLLSLFSRPCNE